MLMVDNCLNRERMFECETILDRLSRLPCDVQQDVMRLLAVVALNRKDRDEMSAMEGKLDRMYERLGKLAETLVAKKYEETRDELVAMSDEISDVAIRVGEIRDALLTPVF